ncbi:MAG: radical SAM protein [bacterium]|nr:radical SAM protein [bacterium]
MRVAIVYPPFNLEGKIPLLSQNRVFIYTHSEKIKIYPLVMAQAATLLKVNGHEVLYLDGINERLNWEEFDKQLNDFSPELVFLETKVPVIRRHWEYINEEKVKYPNRKYALAGDHVSFFPSESMEKSRVDFVITGGDYDSSLSKLVDCLEGSGALPKGVYFRDGDEIKNTGEFELITDLNSLPDIDRELTKWHIYGEAYLQHPCAYILTGRGCKGAKGVGVCRFCIWQFAFWRCTARLRSPAKVVNEIKLLVENYGVKEIFDDNEAGAIWNKEWVEEFYHQMKKQDLIGKVILSSNARADCLLDGDVCKTLKKTGFRLLKIGLESGNDHSLRRLGKSARVEEIRRGIKNAKDFGLRVMVTIMVGYPWESEEDVKQTYRLGKELLLYKTHCGDSLEANIISSYPGTPLFNDALRHNWFDIDPYDYEKYGLAKPILKTPIDAEKWCNTIWRLHLHPSFIFKSLLTSRSIYDIKLLFRGASSLFGHIKDYLK